MFWGHALAPCQYCNVRYPTGIKPAITFCRRNQIALNSVCRWRGPISIYLFCLLIFMQSVTEIQLNKLRAHFRARFAPMIWANCAPLNVWGGGDIITLARIKRENVHVVYILFNVVNEAPLLHAPQGGRSRDGTISRTRDYDFAQAHGRAKLRSQHVQIPFFFFFSVV